MDEATRQELAELRRTVQDIGTRAAEVEAWVDMTGRADNVRAARYIVGGPGAVPPGRTPGDRERGRQASAESRDRITAYLAGQRALYGPSAIGQAAALLDELLAVTNMRGVSAAAGPASWLVTAAGEFAAETVDRRATRTVPELQDLIRDLEAEIDARPGLIRMLPEGLGAGVAVEHGRVGLAVRLYVDDGWTLSPNRSGAGPLVPIYVSADPGGAAEVAELLDDLVHDRIDNPLRVPRRPR